MYNFCVSLFFRACHFLRVHFFVRVYFRVCIIFRACVYFFVRLYFFRACVFFVCVYFSCVYYFRACSFSCVCIFAWVYERMSIYSFYHFEQFCSYVTSASKGSRMPSVLAITSQSKSLISSLPSVYQEENLLFFLALNFFQLDVTILQNIYHHCTH